MTDDVLYHPPVHGLLADGTTVCIRPVTPADHDQLQGLYQEMSQDNLRLRFFSVSRRSGALAADRACAPECPGYRALLAEMQGRVIGIAEYDSAGEKDSAEISIAVCDGLHHRGVGTLLVEHLVSAAAPGLRGPRRGHHHLHGRRAQREPRDSPALRRPWPDHRPSLRGPRGALHHPARPGRRLPVRSRGPRPGRRRGQPRTAAAPEGRCRRRCRPQTRLGRPGDPAPPEGSGYSRRLFAVNPSANHILGVARPTRPSAPCPRLPTWWLWPFPPPRSRPRQRSAAKLVSGRCSSSPADSTTSRRRRCWPRAAPTACGWSAPTASVSPTPNLACVWMPRSPPTTRAPAPQASPCSPAESASPCSTVCPGWASAFRPSPRSATSTTSAATTCSSGGRATGAPNSPCCTWSPSAVRGRSPARPAASPAACRS